VNPTGIEWTDATWNPVRGCTRVSEGPPPVLLEWLREVAGYTGLKTFGPGRRKRAREAAEAMEAWQCSTGRVVNCVEGEP